MRRLTPAYAGAGGLPAGPTIKLGMASRRRLVILALLALIAIALPYLTVGAATIKSLVDPPYTAVAIPELALPVAAFPTRAIPRLRAQRPASAAAGHAPASAASQRQPAAHRTTATRRVVRRLVRRPGKRLPVVTETYSGPGAA
ncbi:MAG: hypothetical protein ACYC0H_08595, partial [Solirubrobacteraceae bacterium]